MPDETPEIEEYRRAYFSVRQMDQELPPESLDQADWTCSQWFAKWEELAKDSKY